MLRSSFQQVSLKVYIMCLCIMEVHIPDGHHQQRAAHLITSGPKICILNLYDKICSDEYLFSKIAEIHHPLQLLQI
jgi:hypothetical protein